MFISAATETLFTTAGVVLLAIAATGRIATARSARIPHRIIVLLGLSAVTYLAAIIVRWLREGQGPFLTLYDVILSNLFSLCLILLVVVLLSSVIRAGTIVALPVLAILGLWLKLVPSEATPLPPTFDNYWLWLHVISGKLFLGFSLIAASSAATLLLSRRLALDSLPGHSAQSEQLDRSVWSVLALAFICHSFMLIAGAVWAHSAWGRYWAWDSLETWTLVTWLILGASLHARVTFPRMPLATGWWLSVGIFVLAFLTFFGIPFISMAPHKGVM